MHTIYNVLYWYRKNMESSYSSTYMSKNKYKVLGNRQTLCLYRNVGSIIKSGLYILKKEMSLCLLETNEKTVSSKDKAFLAPLVFFIQPKANFILWGFKSIWDFGLEVRNKWWNFLSHFLGHFLNKKVMASCCCCLSSTYFSYINILFYLFHPLR